MIYRRCNNCHQLFQGKACPECSKKFAIASAKKIRKEQENKHFYNTSLWQKCRKNIRIKYMDYDIWLLGVGQLYRCENPLVHHIFERDERPDLLFDIDNLITVCKESHEEIHQWYKTDKASALARIEQGKENFRRMFEDD